MHKWAAPEFLEQAAKELIEERWKQVTTEKLPEPSELQATSRGGSGSRAESSGGKEMMFRSDIP